MMYKLYTEWINCKLGQYAIDTDLKLKKKLENGIKYNLLLYIFHSGFSQYTAEAL